MDFFTHGGDIYTPLPNTNKTVLDFSANINPLGLPPQVHDAVVQSLDLCAHYPDPYCRDLTKAIARHHTINPAHILCGNGAADIIMRFTLAQKPKQALLLAPTFSEYEHALQQVNCNTHYFYLEPKSQFAVTDTLLSALTPDLDVLFLCNPNNPTGQIIETELLEQILKTCKQHNIILFMDECFLPFVTNHSTQSMLPYCLEYSNLFILCAFTKLYAMAGLRLGFGVCSNQILLQQMYHCGQPWSVSIPAQHGGIAALHCKDYVCKSLSLIAEERTYLTNELNKLGMQVVPSQANYLLFYSLIPLEKSLKQHSILIRNCENYRGLQTGYYRIAIRTHHENTQLIQTIQLIKKEATSWQK